MYRAISRIAFAITVGVCLFASAKDGAAQAVSARLEGVVQDQTQAVIPGVGVAAINEGTNLKYDSVTNETGRYVFVTLPPGTYRVEAELAGFKRAVRTGVVLQIGDARTLNVILEPGDMNERVTVVAEAPLIDLTTTKIGSVIEQRQIVDLPLNGRNAMMLFYQAVGVSPLDQLDNAPNARTSSQQQKGTVDGLTNSNNVKVEGIFASQSAFDWSPADPTVAVPLEALGEYRITTSGGLSDAGRGSGSKVSVFLKSGTNQIHGSLFEFNRNTVFSANNFFNNRAGQARPEIKRNQFGFSLGGPIVKNRTFFFGTMEWSRQNVSVIQNFLVYTPTLRTGIFRYNTQKANSSADVDANGNPKIAFGTIDLLNVDATRRGMDTVFLPEVLKALPAPNNYDIGDGLNTAGYRITTPQPTNVDQELFKIDHTLTSKHQLSFSFSRSKSSTPSNQLITGKVPGESITSRRALSLRVVSTVSPRVTNELSIGGNLWHIKSPVFDLGQNTPGGRGNIQLTGLTGSGTNGNINSTGISQFHPAVNAGLSDSVSWIKGNHTLSFGGEFWSEIYNRVSGAFNPWPVLRTDNASNPANVPALAGLSATDRTLAQQLTNDLTGTIGSITQNFNVRKQGYTQYQGNYMPMRAREASLYFQDIWKASSRLSMNLGLRYEILPPAYVKDGTFVQPVGGLNGALGIQGPTGQPTTWGFAPDNGKHIIHVIKRNLGPTLGFSYDPFGKGETTVSGSYGIAYDRLPMTDFAQFSQANYGSTTTVVNTPFGRLSDPGFNARFLPVPTPKLFADLGFTRESRAYVVDPNIITPYVQSWSLRIARQIGTGWRIQAAYVGNHAVGLWRAINLNQVEMRNNGFLDAFKIAQNNLAQNGSPTGGASLGRLQGLFALVPASQNNLIATGQAAALADFLDTSTLNTGVRGGLVQAAGLPPTFFRFNPQVQNLNIVGNRTHSTWDGLKLEVNRRLQQGLYIQGNYTLSKGFTDYVPGQQLFEDYRDIANQSLDKAISDFDSTHMLTVNWIYELPIGRGKQLLANTSGILDGLLGGWQLNGISNWVTGRPLRVLAGSCSISNTSSTCSSGRFTVSQNMASTPKFTGERFDLSTVYKDGAQVVTLTPAQKTQFSNPGAGDPGDLPRISLRGPGYANLDLSLFKKFRLGFLSETGEAQLRVEFFNALNHVNFGSPNTNINDGSFGVISTAYPGRVGQLALKILF
jgi:hypothetical protein